MRVHRPSLRRSAVAALAILATAASGMSIALLETAYRLRQERRTMALAIESLALADELSSALLALHGHDAASPDANADAAHLIGRLRDARAFVTSVEEAVALAEATAAVTSYLAREPAASGAPAKGTADRRFEHAALALRRFAGINVDQARAARAEARRLDRRATAILVGVAFAIPACLLGMAAGVRSFVVEPLLSMQRALQRFAGGRRSERVAAGGAEELREVAATFNDMADRIQRDDEERLALLAAIAHDLRTPLTGMKMAAEHLANGAASSDEEKHVATSILLRQTERLDRMLDDLLDATGLEAGKLSFDLAVRDLRDLVTEAGHVLRAAAMEHRVEVVLPEEPVWVACDATRLAQVLGNLGTNAVKYSPPGSVVTIRLTARGRDAILEVVDHGCGIPPDDRERIFELFARGRWARSGGVRGMGIGLAVARRILQVHGGRIEVESTVGVGTTFRGFLPLSPRPASGEPEARGQG